MTIFVIYSKGLSLHWIKYPTSEEHHSSSKVSSTQDVWSSSADSRSVTSDLPSSLPTNTDDAISRSDDKSTGLISVESSRTVSQTSNPVLTTSESGSVSRSASSLDVTSSLADTMFFGNSSSLATGELATSSKIDSSATIGGVHTTDASNTNNDQVSETTKVTHPLNTPTSKYGESNDKPNEDGNYRPVNTKSSAESLSGVVPGVTPAVPSKTTTPAISGSSNNPVVSVYAVETVNLGSRLCIKVISILLPLLLLI
ncbi:hypothetical protein DAKH74_046810 [Maudiozyma humilis]|uniref:Uncharacterized protein n=1 Tax=Maudiozyma humilis TaxID=51915 RepID=A0AAV5S2Y3_MAUHU|nr:hypothetical protein DAKH74_046810 [Kazachstania humilis]